MKKPEFQTENAEENENWFSDNAESDGLESLPNSDNEDSQPKHDFFKESTNVKTCELVVGMKFHNAKHFREVLRDWCVRKGFDVEYIKNEKSRVTAKCKFEGCNWRIHASPVILTLQKLWDYCETVRHFNPGSKMIIKKVEGSKPPVFDKMYVSFAALKNGFLNGCRPIIGLDGCFLKTCYGGQLLVAVGRDGNDNMFPIAMAVVQIENRENWTWFLGELLDDIGGMGTSMWSFISDRQKGLIEALKDLVPDSEHRFCIRHMYENFKMKFKSQELKQFFWKAASTTNKRDFERFMKKIEEIDPKKKHEVETAFEWLKKINSEHWSRAFFPLHSKCDILVNNLCESFNNYILDGRDKPIITMFEWIRCKLMSRLQQKREGMDKFEGDICPNILKKIKKQQLMARNCFTLWCGMDEYEVDHFLDKYVVNLAKRTCTCGMFQLNAYPCCHACAAISTKRVPIDEYVDICYKKSTYLKVYGEMIHAVPGAKDYIQTTYEPLKPPKVKTKRGRPKRLRRRGPDEVQSTSTRKGLTHTCSNCLERGHNKETCKNPTHQKSKFYKGISHEEIPVEGSQIPPTSQENELQSEATRATKVEQTIDGASAATHSTNTPPSIVSTQQIGYQGRRNAVLMGDTIGTSSRGPINTNRNKKPSISEVLERIKERSKKRPWRP
ncbi:UNVERIFIED_CONTAM: hypothetical protein Sindi_1767600 [Sesamum indicum]